MLKAIKNFFDSQLAPQPAEDNEHRLRLAAAALLIEMTEQDHEVAAEEEDEVRTALKTKFALTDEETATLFKLAHREAKQATDFYQFTSLIAKEYTPAQKTELVEHLWAVAYADGHLNPYEEHMVRRVAELLYVSHSDLMQTKHRVLARRNNGG